MQNFISNDLDEQSAQGCIDTIFATKIVEGSLHSLKNISLEAGAAITWGFRLATSSGTAAATAIGLTSLSIPTVVVATAASTAGCLLGCPVGSVLGAKTTDLVDDNMDCLGPNMPEAIQIKEDMPEAQERQRLLPQP